MHLNDLSAYVLTYNEEANIGRCLSAISWVREVVVVDSGSSDMTKEIVALFSNARLVHRSFDSLANQHSFAKSLFSESKWILRLDADWMVSDDLRRFLLEFDGDSLCSGIRVPFRFSIMGFDVPLSLYPPVVCVFRPGCAEYWQDGHTERLRLSGSVLSINEFITHDDRKPIDRFLLSQLRYSVPEAARLQDDSIVRSASLRRRFIFRLRRIPGLSALLIFIFLGFVRLGLFRGPASRHYIIQRVLAELTVSLRILDNEIRKLSARGRAP